MMLSRSLKTLLLAAAMLVPAGAASAAGAAPAVTMSDLNIRTGPAAYYQRYGTIPAGGRVQVFGCLRHTNWCDVAWRGERGWVSGNYLAYRGQRYDREPITEVGIYVGVPSVERFDPYDYHRRHYTGRSWYHDRYLDGPRRDWREDRRELREDRRAGWREERREDERRGEWQRPDWREGGGRYDRYEDE